MHLTRIRLLILGIWLPFILSAQQRLPAIYVSQLMRDSLIHLYDSVYMEPVESRFDTLEFAFNLYNDLGRDTFIYFLEGLNEWVRFDATPLNDSTEAFSRISGRDFYLVHDYEQSEFPALPIPLAKGSAYQCKIDVVHIAYRKASTSIYLFSPAGFWNEMKEQLAFEYTNNIITFVFAGALAFSFCFFFFLFLKSHYPVFGWYAAFLLIHVAYGAIQFDKYTGIGSFMRTRETWDDYVNEILVFVGQAIYVRFMAIWMDVKSSGKRVYYFFNALSIFFLVYAVSFWIVYEINPKSHVLYEMEKWIRLGSIFIQLVFFYVVIFKVRSPVKGYVLLGTFLVLLFGVGFVAVARTGFFEPGPFAYFDYGSWYMIGILMESMCFASGLGLRYFQVEQSNTRLQAENIKVLEAKLEAEKEARENESKLAELNQELTNQQLTALRAQMNPHFIFNALNSIQKYIVTGSVDEANSYLSKFSRLQRMILSYSEENFITLDKEVEILTLYLDLERLRLTNEFSFRIDIDEAIEEEEIRIPPMILQPFAENAIWHGLIPKVGEKRLTIQFQLGDSDILRCIVDDNGIGRQAAQQIKERQADKTINKSKGMSLVHNRLVILERKYGKPFSVRVIDKVNSHGQTEGTRVEIDLPLME